MKFTKFNDKIEKDGMVERTDLLFHAVDALDEAILIAINNRDVSKLSELYDKVLEASDRLVSISMMSQEEEKNNDPKPATLGFKPNTIENKS